MSPIPALVLLSILPIWAVPPTGVAPPVKDPTTPLQYIEGEATCVATSVQEAKDGSTIFLRNTCPSRINFKLCVRKPEDRAPTVTQGSLSPAAVYDQSIVFKGRGRDFKQQTTFCTGLTCVVAEPEC